MGDDKTKRVLVMKDLHVRVMAILRVRMVKKLRVQRMEERRVRVPMMETERGRATE
jgi:hypothetical protein